MFSSRRTRSRFQPTLPLRGATLVGRRGGQAEFVSTHAPLAGSDGPSPQLRRDNPSFNPRSPCGERQAYYIMPLDQFLFQPTLPLRGATFSSS